jgi:hypothetical protein
MQVWTEYPGSCHCFSVLLLSASSSTLSRTLGLVLPVVLRYGTHYLVPTHWSRFILYDNFHF